MQQQSENLVVELVENQQRLESERLRFDKEMLNLKKKEISIRRWRVAVPITLFALYLLFVSLQNAFSTMEEEPYVAVVKVRGEIGEGKSASLSNLRGILEEAFNDEDAKGVVLKISSPGGTPVAADDIRGFIRLLMEKHKDKKVIAYGGELMTSGAYLVATAADEIYANPNSMVGSIGVVAKSFGFQEVARKLGVERRILTSGEHKVRMDAFLPVKSEDKLKFEELIKEIHERFIASVKDSRGDKLDLSEPTLFSGDYWTGAKALKLGLVDGVGTYPDILEKVFGVTKEREHKSKKPLLRLLTDPVVSVMESMESSSKVMLLPGF